MVSRVQLPLSQFLSMVIHFDCSRVTDTTHNIINWCWRQRNLWHSTGLCTVFLSNHHFARSFLYVSYYYLKFIVLSKKCSASGCWTQFWKMNEKKCLVIWHDKNLLNESDKTRTRLRHIANDSTRRFRCDTLVINYWTCQYKQTEAPKISIPKLNSIVRKVNRNCERRWEKKIHHVKCWNNEVVEPEYNRKLCVCFFLIHSRVIVSKLATAQFS